MPAKAIESAAVDERGYIGSAFRVAVEFLTQRGYAAAVKERVTAQTAALIDNPPFPFAWMPVGPMDELQTALLAVAGRPVCVELGMAAGRSLGGSMIAPVLRMATSLFGNTPVTLFQNLERFYALVLKGMTFTYESIGPREGWVVTRVHGPNAPEALFDVTRGNLVFVFELCGVNGHVDPPADVRREPWVAEARYKVRWS